MRRVERERAKVERERQRLAVLQAALEAQERLDAEIDYFYRHYCHHYLRFCEA